LQNTVGFRPVKK